MYEARQNKEKVSRTICGGLAKQQVKMLDGRTIMQFKRFIEAKNELTKNEAIGYSSNNKPQNYSDFEFLFRGLKAWWYPKKGVKGSPSDKEKDENKYYKREPYFCAEPHALFALWEKDKVKITNDHAKKIKWLMNVTFPDIASADDEIPKSQKETPCNVCSQWLTSSTPLKILKTLNTMDLGDYISKISTEQNGKSRTNSMGKKKRRAIVICSC